MKISKPDLYTHIYADIIDERQPCKIAETSLNLQNQSGLLLVWLTCTVSITILRPFTYNIFIA